MTLIQKIRTSFSTQLSLWVAGFVLVIFGVVIFLFARFSEHVIRDESIDTTLQALENTALRVDNTLRQTEMMARLKHQQLRVNRSRIERLIEENGLLATLQHTLPHAQLYVTRRDSSQFDFYITGGASGYRQLKYNNEDIYIFSQPLGNRAFCLVAVTPSEDIHGRYGRMHWVLLSSGVVAILLLICILYLVIGFHLRPLHRLADSAQAIAKGDLNTPIPDTLHIDETGRLQNSLSLMQRRLAAYMNEMQQKKNVLKQQHAELQAAYDEVKNFEQKKARFLHDMTDRMAVPVEMLCRSADTICRDYRQLSKDEMTALQTEIMQISETITQFLDQLIKTPADS